MEWLVVFNLAGYGIVPVSPLWLTIVDLGGQLPESGNFVFKFYTFRHETFHFTGNFFSKENYSFGINKYPTTGNHFT